MEKELMQRFLNKRIKLTLKPHFVIDGTVTEVLSSGFFFLSTQKEAYISYDLVLQITPLEEAKL